MAMLLIVSPEEAGQKLFNFLQRCLKNENSELHRWIRSGQVRINSARAKAFDRVNEGDMIRIPPFAEQKIFAEPVAYPVAGQEFSTEQKDHSVFKGIGADGIGANIAAPCVESGANTDGTRQAQHASPTLAYEQYGHKKIIEKVYEDEHIIAIDKPFDLPCQGGTGHQVHLAQILKDTYQHLRFIPAPAHRLDKHSTGLVLIGKSYKGLKFLSDFMQQENKPFTEEFVANKPHKEYLAWVHTPIYDGILDVPQSHEPFYMVHYLYQDEEKGRMQALSLKEICEINSNLMLEIFSKFTSSTGKKIKESSKILQGKVPFSKENARIMQALPSHIILKNKVKTQVQVAFSLVECLKVQDDFSLLKIGIFTGRKHQIRVQCAQLGFALVGDGKYGHKNEDTLKLHAYRIYLPNVENDSSEKKEAKEIKILPNWDNNFSVDWL